jgi:hypothetical protein
VSEFDFKGDGKFWDVYSREPIGQLPDAYEVVETTYLEVGSWQRPKGFALILFRLKWWLVDAWHWLTGGSDGEEEE